MTKNDWFYISFVALFTSLFFRQVPGLNLLIFSLVYTAYCFWKSEDPFNKKLLSLALLCTLAGVSVFLYGNLLSFLAVLTSLSCLSFVSFSRDSSLLASFFFSIYDLLFALFHILVDADQRISNTQKPDQKKILRRILLTVGPLIVLLIFVVIYRNASPVFDDLISKIDLSISPQLIGFTFLGALLMYGTIYPRGLKAWVVWETSRSNQAPHEDTWDKHLSAHTEIRLASIILGLLNVLLLVFNLTDMSYLFFGAPFPSNQNLSEILHGGVNLLIFSIVLAIAIVLIFFRGRLNYIKENKGLKILAFVWITLNGLMVFVTAYKNHIYINDFGLTYKRIGVYVYLLLTGIGLMYTAFKIGGSKSNWFLVRQVGWYFVGTLVIGALLPWNSIIAENNLNKHIHNEQDVDMDYLLSLGPDVYPVMMSYEHELRLKGHDDALRKAQMGIQHHLKSIAEKDWRSFVWKDHQFKKRFHKDSAFYTQAMDKTNSPSWILTVSGQGKTYNL